MENFMVSKNLDPHKKGSPTDSSKQRRSARTKQQDDSKRKATPLVDACLKASGRKPDSSRFEPEDSRSDSDDSHSDQNNSRSDPDYSEEKSQGLGDVFAKGGAEFAQVEEKEAEEAKEIQDALVDTLSNQGKSFFCKLLEALSKSNNNKAREENGQSRHSNIELTNLQHPQERRERNHGITSRTSNPSCKTNKNHSQGRNGG
jgi:hypothetical protein